MSMEVSHLHSREEKDLQIQLHGQLGKILIELQDEWDLTKGSFMNQTEMEYDQTLQNCFQFLQNSDERVLAFMKQICSLREEILKQREKKVETQNLISNLENIPPSQSQTYEEYFRPFLKNSTSEKPLLDQTFVTIPEIQLIEENDKENQSTKFKQEKRISRNEHKPLMPISENKNKNNLLKSQIQKESHKSDIQYSLNTSIGTSQSFYLQQLQKQTEKTQSKTVKRNIESKSKNVQFSSPISPLSSSSSTSSEVSNFSEWTTFSMMNTTDFDQQDNSISNQIQFISNNQKHDHETSVMQMTTTTTTATLDSNSNSSFILHKKSETSTPSSYSNLSISNNNVKLKNLIPISNSTSSSTSTSHINSLGVSSPSSSSSTSSSSSNLRNTLSKPNSQRINNETKNNFSTFETPKSINSSMLSDIFASDSLLNQTNLTTHRSILKKTNVEISPFHFTPYSNSKILPIGRSKHSKYLDEHLFEFSPITDCLDETRFPNNFGSNDLSFSVKFPLDSTPTTMTTTFTTTRPSTQSIKSFNQSKLENTQKSKMKSLQKHEQIPQQQIIQKQSQQSQQPQSQLQPQPQPQLEPQFQQQYSQFQQFQMYQQFQLYQQNYGQLQYQHQFNQFHQFNQGQQPPHLPQQPQNQEQQQKQLLNHQQFFSNDPLQLQNNQQTHQVSELTQYPLTEVSEELYQSQLTQFENSSFKCEETFMLQENNQIVEMLHCYHYIMSPSKDTSKQKMVSKLKSRYRKIVSAMEN